MTRYRTDIMLNMYNTSPAVPLSRIIIPRASSVPWLPGIISVYTPAGFPLIAILTSPGPTFLSTRTAASCDESSGGLSMIRTQMRHCRLSARCFPSLIATHDLIRLTFERSLVVPLFFVHIPSPIHRSVDPTSIIVLAQVLYV